MEQASIANHPATTAGVPPLRLFRPKTPATALGLAVNHLMTKPAFAHLQFGDWSRVLAGQINRSHYYFAIDDKNEIVGFIGWAITTKDRAEAWVEGRAGLSDEHAREGDCILFNGWAANTAEVNRFLLEAARLVCRGKETIYFKRHYKDGTTRPVRLSVNAFLERHIEHRQGRAGGV
jgi:hemolysin-activating ACP:hemolysin acyltransferase